MVEDCARRRTSSSLNGLWERRYVESGRTVRPWTVCAWEGCFGVGTNPSAVTTYGDSQAGFRRRSKRPVDYHDLDET